MRTLISNGSVINPTSGIRNADVLIEDDKIVSVNAARSYASIDRVIDAKGLCVAPGLVDTHVHFRDPGQTWKEDILTGAMAAKRGGFTTVVMMANTMPPIDNVETLRYVINKSAQADIHVKTCATVTIGMKGEELTDMPALVEAGAVGFTDDGKTIMDSNLVKQAMLTAKKLKVPISFHEEDPRYVKTAGYNDSQFIRDKLNINGAHWKAESRMIARDIWLAVHTRATVNFQHISSAESVWLLRSVIENLSVRNIHAEATPHHLALTEKDVIELGTLAKMNPPLRLKEDRQAIMSGVGHEYIDIIATDHAPHTTGEKRKGLIDAPSGVIGLETALGVVLTELYHRAPAKYKLSLSAIIKRMSYNPARLYELKAGIIQKGFPADIVIFNPDEKWIVEKDFASGSENCPFIGRELIGKVKYTICDGRIVYADN